MAFLFRITLVDLLTDLQRQHLGSVVRTSCKHTEIIKLRLSFASYDIAFLHSVRGIYALNFVSGLLSVQQVAHRELQFEIRDHRHVPTIPVQRFGYKTFQVHGRYMKGKPISPTSSLFN
jgi:hypothetical protein